MNKTLENIAKNLLKDLLIECTEEQQLMFKRMYSHKNLELPINECVDCMDPTKIDWAITQCENSVEKNKLKTI